MQFYRRGRSLLFFQGADLLARALIVEVTNALLPAWALIVGITMRGFTGAGACLRNENLSIII